MKKLFFPMAVAVVLGMASCAGKTADGNGATNSDASEAAFKVDSVGYTDNAKWVAEGGENETSYSVNVSADYPVEGPQILVDSVRAYIAAAVDAPADADMADGKKLMEAAAKKMLTEAKAEGDFGEMGGESIFGFKLVYETPQFVTFDMTQYIYSGGAHGAGMTSGVTFNAANGATIGWNIFTPESKDQLETLVKNALATQYFEMSDWAAYQAEYNQEFALPVAAPAFTGDGVTFYYAPYEIGPYSAGAPTCTLSYAEMTPLMTPEAAALVK